MGDKKKSRPAPAPKGRAKRKRPQMRKAYICECQVCGNGLVRFWNFRDDVVGLCDECELVWEDVERLFRRPRSKVSGSFPGGSDGDGSEADWKRATRRDVERADLGGFVAGYSD